MTSNIFKKQCKTMKDIEVICLPSNLDSNIIMNREKIMESEVPFYQINLGHIYQQFVRFKNLLPRVQPFYAVKCQPDIQVISLLGKLGAGFDCASKQEIETVIKCMTYDNTEIETNVIFANPYKFKKDIRYAKQVGVTTVTFDTESELVKLSQQWPSVKLVIRISPTRLYNATGILGNKFGANHDEIKYLLQRAKELSMDIVGVSFHVGSGCMEMNAFPETVIYCSEIFELARQMGFDFTLLDIGGGFPGLSSLGDDTTKQMQFEEMCSKLNEVFDMYFPESGNYKIIAEPGRYFVYGAYTLLTEVIGVRSLDLMSSTSSCDNVACHKISDESDNDVLKRKLVTKGYRYVINDGVYNSFNCIVFDHYTAKALGIFDNEYKFREVNQESEYFLSTIYGPTCDGFDCIMQQKLFPKLEIGNWIVWPNMGAYTIAASSCFNGIPVAETNYFMFEADEEHMETFLCNQ